MSDCGLACKKDVAWEFAADVFFWGGRELGRTKFQVWSVDKCVAKACMRVVLPSMAIAVSKA
eukprot:82252-Chlamydomonas_euryale.AAC.6